MSDTAKPIEIFYSYAEEDEELRKKLDNHLSILKASGVISEWHDRNINSGTDWEKRIDEHLNSADIILLLISPYFLASRYCYSFEIDHAIKRHQSGEARVIPVILRAVDWHTSPFSRLQALPTDGKPILAWSNRDKAFANVLRGIRNIIEDMTTKPLEGFAGHKRSLMLRGPNLTILPTIWNVPHLPNPNFVGREDLMLQVRAAFTSGITSLSTQVITGLGGIGKTQFIVEYAYNFSGDYDLVWWLRADDNATIVGDYSQLAVELELPEKEATDQWRIVEAVRRWLERNSRWLLIFDNAKDPMEIRNFLPRKGNGHVLITSRNPNWRGVADTIAIPVLRSQEAIQFIRKRTGQSDIESAAALASAMGNLPLALEQAGAYIEQTGKSIADYLQLWQVHKANLVAHGTTSIGYPANLATTWELAFQEIQSRSPVGANLINLCAYLGSSGIPLDILLTGSQSSRDSVLRTLNNQLVIDDGVASLRRYSVVEVDIAEQLLIVHPLVQTVARQRLSDEERIVWSRAATELLNINFPQDSDDSKTWNTCATLLDHALAATDHVEQLECADDQAAELLLKLALYIGAHGRFAEAAAFSERALAINQRVLGPDHPVIARNLNNLGDIRRKLGDLSGARSFFERALSIDEVVNGANHPTVSRDLNHLGIVLRDIGDLTGAQAAFKRALAIDESAYGPDHPAVAIRLSNLGSVLRELGDLQGAHSNFKRALAIDEAVYGPDHPNVATDQNNLGSVLRELGDLQGARSNLERALAINESAYGPDHPNVATDQNNLGSILEDMGDLIGAKSCFERALIIDESVYGPNHLAVAIRLNNLGNTQIKLGNAPEAQANLGRALQIFQDYLGEKHPYVEIASRNLRRVTGDAL
jgi:tetratricopeptide (TPR) repeat protein